MTKLDLAKCIFSLWLGNFASIGFIAWLMYLIEGDLNWLMVFISLGIFCAGDVIFFFFLYWMINKPPTVSPELAQRWKNLNQKP